MMINTVTMTVKTKELVNQVSLGHNLFGWTVSSPAARIMVACIV